MKIYYLQSNNRIVAAKYNDEVFKFDTNTLSPFNIFEIDEVDPFNKAICLDLVRTVNKVDEVGEGKYYINSSGILMEKEGWIEKVEEIF